MGQDSAFGYPFVVDRRVGYLHDWPEAAIEVYRVLGKVAHFCICSDAASVDGV